MIEIARTPPHPEVERRMLLIAPDPEMGAPLDYPRCDGTLKLVWVRDGQLRLDWFEEGNGRFYRLRHWSWGPDRCWHFDPDGGIREHELLPVLAALLFAVLKARTRQVWRALRRALGLRRMEAA